MQELILLAKAAFEESLKIGLSINRVRLLRENVANKAMPTIDTSPRCWHHLDPIEKEQWIAIAQAVIQAHSKQRNNIPQIGTWNFK